MKHMSRAITRLLAVAALLVVSVAIAGAQTQGGISGLVTDSSGAAIPGATVTVTNTATRGMRTTTTNAEGLYSFPSLPPGFYAVKVELQGFKTAELSKVKVDIEQTVRLDVPLQVGNVEESVTVSGTATLLNTESTTLGTVIENKIVTELPLNGRQYLNLVAMAPNVNMLSPGSGQAGSRLGGERAQQSISTGGQRIFFNYYTLDGVSNMDVNFNNYIALPSIDAIQEFKVQTGVYPAEFGHQSTQVNVVTKSGGNAFHASIFEFVRDEKFDAKPYAFTSVHPAKSPFKWNDYGFEADGPVLKDKLFFMGNFEGLRRRQTTLSTFSVPSAKMFTGDFSEILPGTVIYDPLTGQPFPGNVIPATRIDPLSQSLLKYYHSATLAGLSNNYVQDNSQPFDRKGYVVRADFNESSASQWMKRNGRLPEKSLIQSATFITSAAVVAGERAVVVVELVAVAAAESPVPVEPGGVDVVLVAIGLELRGVVVDPVRGEVVLEPERVDRLDDAGVLEIADGVLDVPLMRQTQDIQDGNDRDGGCLNGIMLAGGATFIFCL